MCAASLISLFYVPLYLYLSESLPNSKFDVDVSVKCDNKCHYGREINDKSNEKIGEEAQAW